MAQEVETCWPNRETLYRITLCDLAWRVPEIGYPDLVTLLESRVSSYQPWQVSDEVELGDNHFRHFGSRFGLWNCHLFLIRIIRRCVLLALGRVGRWCFVGGHPAKYSWLRIVSSNSPRRVRGLRQLLDDSSHLIGDATIRGARAVQRHIKDPRVGL